MKNIIIIIVATTLLFSCEADFLSGENSGKPDIITNENIIGNWSQNDYIDSLSVLKKTGNLPDDQYGVSFFEDGTLKEWKNVGFCGTPPVTYGEFEGTWELKNDSVLIINGTYWGGDVNMEWKIIEIDDRRMSYFVQKWDAALN